jgi:membrane-bound metal-dependent hydrolase YbcI (DUF457 family)
VKGITHFSVGVAAASIFPEAVESAAGGNPLYFIAGGVAGLLPDTMDFKFRRFFAKHDIEVVPDPLCPDAELIARSVILAMTRAAESGKAVWLRLHTIKVGPDRWQSYKVIVEFGDIVDTGNNVRPRELSARGLAFRLPTGFEISFDYDAEMEVSIFDGPVISFEPEGRNHVHCSFIPWHRQFSHSITFGLMLGVLTAVLADLTAGMIVFIAQGMHVLVDQAGFLGSNLWHPFTRRRKAGWKLIRSDSVAGNMAVSWSACLVVFWNLYKHSECTAWDLNPVRLFLWLLGLPALAGMMLMRWIRGFEQSGTGADEVHHNPGKNS